MNSTWYSPNIINYLFSLGTVYVVGNEINLNYNNINFVFNANDEVEIFNEIFFRKEYEVPINKDSVVIDIGANVGIATLYFASNPYVRKVYSYEPFELTYNCFMKNINSNPKLSSKIQPNNFGMGKSDRVSKGIINDILKGNSKIYDGEKLPPSYETHPGKYVVKEVLIRRASTIIKQIIEENKGLDVVIKMDCEGGEIEIFEDEEFIALLENIKAIVMETHTPEIFNKISQILKDKNFTCTKYMVSEVNGYINAYK